MSLMIEILDIASLDIQASPLQVMHGCSAVYTAIQEHVLEAGKEIFSWKPACIYAVKR